MQADSPDALPEIEKTSRDKVGPAPETALPQEEAIWANFAKKSLWAGAERGMTKQDITSPLSKV